MLKQIVMGLLIAGVGAAMIFFSTNLVEMFGRIDRAEKNLSGTRNGYILFGFIIIIIGILMMFGVLGTQSPTDVATTTL